MKEEKNRYLDENGKWSWKLWFIDLALRIVLFSIFYGLFSLCIRGCGG